MGWGHGPITHPFPTPIIILHHPPNSPPNYPVNTLGQRLQEACSDREGSQEMKRRGIGDLPPNPWNFISGLCDWGN